MSVTVFAGLYGTGYNDYVPAWLKAVKAVKGVNRVIIGSDRERTIKGADVVVSECEFTHPSAWFQNQAVNAADTDWVWQMQIDDLAHPDALTGLDQCTADVFLLGYQRSDGFGYIPPALTPGELLASPDNPFVMASPIRLDAFGKAGGYPDIAYEDWGLWRKMARNGCTFASSGNAGFTYNWHPETSRTSADAKERSRHVAEALAL